MFFLMKDHEKPGCFNFSASGRQCQACSLTNQGGSCWAQPPRDLLTEKFRFCIFAPSFCSKWACWWNLDEVCSYLHHRHDCQPESHESCWTIPHVVGALDHFLYSFPIFVGMMIQSDELIFSEGLKPTTNQSCVLIFAAIEGKKPALSTEKQLGPKGPVVRLQEGVSAPS